MKEQDLIKIKQAQKILQGLEYLRGSTKNHLISTLDVEIEHLEAMIKNEKEMLKQRDQ